MERIDSEKIIRIIQACIKEADKKVKGCIAGTNCGESAEQTIFHAHMHLIPRRDAGSPDTGGMRGIIPNKMNYL